MTGSGSSSGSGGVAPAGDAVHRLLQALAERYGTSEFPARAAAAGVARPDAGSYGRWLRFRKSALASFVLGGRPDRDGVARWRLRPAAGVGRVPAPVLRDPPPALADAAPPVPPEPPPGAASRPWWLAMCLPSRRPRLAGPRRPGAGCGGSPAAGSRDERPEFRDLYAPGGARGARGMASIRQLVEAFEAEAREAAARPDPLAGHRGRMAEVLAALERLAADPPPRLARARCNRLGHALDAARREVRRAADALAPRGPALGMPAARARGAGEFFPQPCARACARGEAGPAPVRPC